MSRVRIFSQNLFGLCCQRIEPAPHVRHPSRQPNPRVAGHWDHVMILCTRPRTAESAAGPSTRIRRPSDKVMSTRCAQTPTPDGSDAPELGRRTSTSDGSLTSMGRKVAPPSSNGFGTSTRCGANRGILQPLEYTIGIHQIPTRDLCYQYIHRRRLFTDRALLVIWPHPLLLTLLARYSVPKDVHYQWWTLSSHLHNRQSRNTGRLLTCRPKAHLSVQVDRTDGGDHTQGWSSMTERETILPPPQPGINDMPGSGSTIT
jgi:hypothetical protein